MIEHIREFPLEKLELPVALRRIEPDKEDKEEDDEEEEKKSRRDNYGYLDMEPQSSSSIRPVPAVEPPVET